MPYSSRTISMIISLSGAVTNDLVIVKVTTEALHLLDQVDAGLIDLAAGHEAYQGQRNNQFVHCERSTGISAVGTD